MQRVILSLSIFLFLTSFSQNLNAQWLNWQEYTSNSLTLNSIASTDNEEKDIATGDLNNDGYTDAIVVRKEPFLAFVGPAKIDVLLLNNKAGQLVDETTTYAPQFAANLTYASDVLILDIDNDGWQDVVIATTNGQAPILYRNQGLDPTGTWIGLLDESAIYFPAFTDDVPYLCSVTAGDITGNGFVDLYFTNAKSSGIALDYLLINDGTGVFTNESTTRLGNLRNSAFGTCVAMNDMDGDGDMDLLKSSVAYNVMPWNEQGLFILFNDGTGNFSNPQKVSVQTTGTTADSPYMFTVLDVNLDGKQDIYVVDAQNDYQLFNTGAAQDAMVFFNTAYVTSTRIADNGGNIKVADLDMDGDLDIAISDVAIDSGPCASGRSFALLENVNGFLVDTYGSSTYPWDVNVYDVGFLDIDDDGLTDFLLAECDAYTVYLSDNCQLTPGTFDFDLDGVTNACDPCPTNPNLTCTTPLAIPTPDLRHSIARQWNDLLLESIRKDFARPTVHARNLFHTSVAMWDAWSAYDNGSCTYLLGQTVDGFTCAFDPDLLPVPSDVTAAKEEAISYAMYRILSHRFINSPQISSLQTAYNFHMGRLGYDISIAGTDYTSGSPAELGNYIAQCIIDFGLQDGANEQNAYGNTSYAPVNNSLIIVNPGNPSITDYNRWQPLTLQVFIDQSGNQIPGTTPGFLSPEWGQVANFALSDSDLTINQRNGFDYYVYHDPGMPPELEMTGGGTSEIYQEAFAMVTIWSSHLDPNDGVMWDISPNGIGNRTITSAIMADPYNFYNLTSGGTVSPGHTVNPKTGQPYAPVMVPRGDYARVLAEFWADGPDSETPPGHWFTLLNYVSDHPAVVKQFQGQGPVLGDLEWDVKSYLTMGGAMHDAAVTAWGIKGWYDYIRPISAIRAMADLGQSSDPAGLSYHPAGIPLVPGYIEIIQPGDPLTMNNKPNVGKIKVKAWRGHDFVNNTFVDEAGVDWILAEDWMPYQRPSFVTPPFAGYVSGHSTFSRAAAEVMTMFTGDEFFPGGLGVFVAPQDEFLVFEDGPSMDIELQWATYYDAADESGLSRIWGGIHPYIDDIPGRVMGKEIGIDAFNKASSYFMDADNDGVQDICDVCPSFDDALIGTICDDNDDCTTNDIYTAACNCAGVLLDANNDGSCDVRVAVTVMLEGAYDSGTNLMTNNIPLPNSQPFNTTPWNYMGTESFIMNAPNNAIDWVLLEARDGNNNNLILEQAAGIVLADGKVVAADGSPLSFFNITLNDSYYVSVKTRHHLAVITDAPVALPNSTSPVDFTDVNIIMAGNTQVNLMSDGTTYALRAGDFNSDGVISVEDFNDYVVDSSAVNQYLDTDCNLDGNVTIADFNKYMPNASSIGVPAIRY